MVAAAAEDGLVREEGGEEVSREADGAVEVVGHGKEVTTVDSEVEALEAIRVAGEVATVEMEDLIVTKEEDLEGITDLTENSNIGSVITSIPNGDYNN